MDRYICIHGHFYQPPRENPWLEAIEVQDSAYPYHDWNERITAECYAPNMASRILDSQGRIVEIVNNYSKMSFNFGPTLLSWLETKASDVYKSILEADVESQKLYSGHGSAMAQTYNHMIMPLANARDKRTQVIWGLRDFEHRFGRKPEGMWLPETAVDLETLDILSEFGIKFTILSPHQASRFRKLNTAGWTESQNGSIDPSGAYQLKLPSGRSITLFFYDGPVSRAVAFEKLLSQGEFFANRLVNSFSTQRKHQQLAHIATDGETFGHHHRYGEMALSYALRYISENKLAQITNYGEFLEKFPPEYEVEINEKTSWSCGHGIERWRSDCGCNIGTNSAWNQKWRAPLRGALEWLRDTLTGIFESQCANYFKDPWAARDAYINVILNREEDTVETFLKEHALKDLNEGERIAAQKLMELQRHAMLMFTSCGWFFDELSNIETIQVIQYAGRALQLAQELSGQALEEEFLKRMELAQSNLPFYKDGRQIYERFVRPAMVDLQKVGAHYALSSLFEPYEETARIYCYTFQREAYTLAQEGKSKLALGHVRISSDLTSESKNIVFCAVHLGDHNLNGGTREFKSEEDYQDMVKQLSDAFEHADLPSIFRYIDKNFLGGIYSLKALFHDEKRKIINIVLDTTLAEAEAAYHNIYEHHAPLIRFLSDMNMPLPKPFGVAAEQALNTDLRMALEVKMPDIDRIDALLDDAKRTRVRLDHEGLSFTLGKTIERLAQEFEKNPANLMTLHHLELLAKLSQIPPLHVDFWKTQNIYYDMIHAYLPNLQGRTDETSKRWTHHFLALGETLRVKV